MESTIIEYPIPANDDAARSVELLVEFAKESIEEGQGRGRDKDKESKKDKVKVKKSKIKNTI